MKNSITTNNSYSPINEMRLLSQGRLHDPFLTELTGKNVDNQIRLFLAAQARNELQRILQLTEFLDNIENKFMNAINKQLIEQPDNINLLMTAMEMITQSLKRSNELVYNVLKDNSLQTLVVNTVNVIPGAEQTSILSRKSRDAIRSVASNLIAQLQEEQLNKNVIDVDETTENTDTTNIDINTIATNKLNELLD